jgi:hypothetical protein
MPPGKFVRLLSDRLPARECELAGARSTAAGRVLVFHDAPVADLDDACDAATAATGTLAQMPKVR